MMPLNVRLGCAAGASPSSRMRARASWICASRSAECAGAGSGSRCGRPLSQARQAGPWPPAVRFGLIASPGKADDPTGDEQSPEPDAQCRANREPQQRHDRQAPQRHRYQKE